MHEGGKVDGETTTSFRRGHYVGSYLATSALKKPDVVYHKRFWSTHTTRSENQHYSWVSYGGEHHTNIRSKNHNLLIGGHKH